MKFSHTITIGRPRERIYELLANPPELKSWFPGFVASEPLGGAAGTPGATARLTFETASGPIVLLETVIDRQPPDLLATTYEFETVIYSLMHHLESVAAAETRWTLECTSDVERGGWLVNWLLSRTLQAAGRKGMAQFKAKVEAATLT